MKQIKTKKQWQKTWKIAPAFLCFILVVSIGIAMAISSIPGTQANNIEKIGVGIYQDPKCEESLDHIAWGEINLDSTVTQTIYVKNEVDSSCFLSLSTLNWTPAAASKYLSLEWNYSGQEVAPDQAIPIALSLTVSESALDLTDFNFIICISAQK
jgi:hypothetical protein